MYCENKGEIIGGESFPPTLNNIKLIQVVESNKDNHMSNDELSYNNFIITKFQFENDCITLGIDMVNEYSEDYLSGNCRIIQKNETINNGNIENITIEPSQISFRKLSKCDIEININTYGLTNELERGKYIFIFENEELGVIKIPFEKTYDGIVSDY